MSPKKATKQNNASSVIKWHSGWTSDGRNDARWWWSHGSICSCWVPSTQLSNVNAEKHVNKWSKDFLALPFRAWARKIMFLMFDFSFMPLCVCLQWKSQPLCFLFVLFLHVQSKHQTKIKHFPPVCFFSPPKSGPVAKGDLVSTKLWNSIPGDLRQGNSLLISFKSNSKLFFFFKSNFTTI